LALLLIALILVRADRALVRGEDDLERANAPI
jgi:hypothetical protein